MFRRQTYAYFQVPRGTLLCDDHILPAWGPHVLNSTEATALKSLPLREPPVTPVVGRGAGDQEEDTPYLTCKANCNGQWEESVLILSLLMS